MWDFFGVGGRACLSLKQLAVSNTVTKTVQCLSAGRVRVDFFYGEVAIVQDVCFVSDSPNVQDETASAKISCLNLLSSGRVRYREVCYLRVARLASDIL